ncbi:MAG: glycerophosphodiester phosphodiesterase [Lachnospiraceae bacterium]|nr:glycerophosphodiester phosphodiesterase [Lachnospiraceae bacterium]
MLPFLLTTAIILALLVFIFAFLVAPGTCSEEKRAPFLHQNIAHRGLHTKDKKIPENSIAAFSNAVKNGYGIELDIQLTKDDKIVVFHDDTLDRVCNLPGAISSYTYEELCDFRLCGTDQKIPLFTEALRVIDGKVPVVVEFKNGSKNKLLCERALPILRSYQGDFCIESFQPYIVSWFRKNAPDILRGQLSAGMEELKQLGFFKAFCLSNVLTNVTSRPHFIAYEKDKKTILVRLSEKMGAMKAVWTIRDTDKKHYYEMRNDMVIFEHYRPKIKY